MAAVAAAGVVVEAQTLAVAAADAVAAVLDAVRELGCCSLRGWTLRCDGAFDARAVPRADAGGGGGFREEWSVADALRAVESASLDSSVSGTVSTTSRGAPSVRIAVRPPVDVPGWLGAAVAGLLAASTALLP